MPVSDEAVEAQIKHMVDRFLSWKLPQDFRPDGGISFEPVGNRGTANEYRREPFGTNLLDAIQATAMVRHMLDGLHLLPAPSALPEGEALGEQTLSALRGLEDAAKACDEEAKRRAANSEAAKNGYRYWGPDTEASARGTRPSQRRSSPPPSAPSSPSHPTSLHRATRTL